MTYSELLERPEWQAKRMEILDADSRCEKCGDPDGPFDVHHGLYESGVKPWDYPNETLHVLCRDCHTVTEHEMIQLRRELALVDVGHLLEITSLLRRLCRLRPEAISHETHDWLARGRELSGASGER